MEVVNLRPELLVADKADRARQVVEGLPNSRYDGFDRVDVVVEFDALGPAAEIEFVGDAEILCGRGRRFFAYPT
jgi:hypothetical protein